MQTALEHYGEIDADDILLLTQIRLWLNGLPDKGNANRVGDHLWSCHALARAAHRTLDLGRDGWRVVDGYFARPWHDHTWLVREATAPGARDLCRIVLDVQPYASAGGPIMVSATSANSPWLQLYGTDYQHLGRYKDRLHIFEADAEVLVAVTEAKRSGVI